MSTELNLLPCPFCGSERIGMHQRDYMDFAMCSDCTAEGPSVDDKRIAAESWNCRGASSAAAVPDGALPPPKVPRTYQQTEQERAAIEAYGRECARAAVEADRRERGLLEMVVEQLKARLAAADARIEELEAADRAQQGEPVDERAAFNAWFEANKFGGMRESMWAAWEARAATKAAAPADAPKIAGYTVKIDPSMPPGSFKLAAPVPDTGIPTNEDQA